MVCMVGVIYVMYVCVFFFTVGPGSTLWLERLDPQPNSMRPHKDIKVLGHDFKILDTSLKII